MVSAAQAATARRHEESQMTDTCRVGIEKRSGPIDETTGQFPTAIVPVYEGICEFKAANVQAQALDAASQQLVSQTATLKLPVATSTAVVKDLVVEITTSRHDPGIVGLKARIAGPFDASFTTTRRFPVEVIS